jgi:hypothetical protein
MSGRSEGGLARSLEQASLADQDDGICLARAFINALQNPAWLKDQCSGSVVLFAWAMSQYTPIARARKGSGALLFLYSDASGLWNPWSDGPHLIRSYWSFKTRTYGRAIGIPRFVLGALRQSVTRFFAIRRLELRTKLKYQTAYLPAKGVMSRFGALVGQIFLLLGYTPRARNL